MNTTNKEILNIAIPSIISNITVPLLGLVDVTIVGHLGSASYIGAIAIGGMLFNMIYWLFGFLRMGTGGMTSQAYGRNDTEEYNNILLRSLSISTAIALVMIMLQIPVRETAFLFIDASEEVKTLAAEYFHICIWGAPATLGLYSLTGWFIGIQNSRYPMFIAITQNIINIVVSLLLVTHFDMKIAGIAYGTLTAQYAGLIMALLFAARYFKKDGRHSSLKNIFKRKSMNQFFKVNRDIFLRTLCIVVVTVFFTSTGAAYGDTMLAVNTLLMQMFTIFSYIMDGFAYAGEAIIGKNIGAKDFKQLHRTIKHLLLWGAGVATAFTIMYALGGKGFLSILTNDMAVINASENYYYWVLAIPLAGVLTFILDGICIGATATGIMLKSIFIASLCFFLLFYTTNGTIGNHSLWLSFITYLLARGCTQSVMTLRLIRSDYRAS